MTTPIDESMFTLAIPPRLSNGPSTLYIPEEQRRPNDTLTKLYLPAGMHTLQLLWRGVISTIDLRLDDDVSTYGFRVVTLPRDADATPVIYTLVVPPGGGHVYFVQNSAVTDEELSTNLAVLGVTVFLNEARKPLE